MIASRATIATLIPHAGAMCLLDGLLAWDEASVRCVSRRYAGMDNPMRRRNGTLGIAAGIEIAAQAMALHGALSAPRGARPAQGFLTSLRDVRFAGSVLDASAGEMLVEAERLAGDAGGASYRFTLSRHDAMLLSGRATVILSVAA